MEILKQLLAQTFEKRIERLEGRTTQNLKDLKFTAGWFIKYEKELERLKQFKIPERSLVKNRTTDNLKRDTSAISIRPNRNYNKDVKVERSRNRTPNYAQPIERSRSKTPVIGGASVRGNKTTAELTPRMGSKTTRKAVTVRNKTPDKTEKKHVVIAKKKDKESGSVLSPSPSQGKKVIKRQAQSKNQIMRLDTTIQSIDDNSNNCVLKTVQLSNIDMDLDIKQNLVTMKSDKKINISEFIKEHNHSPMFESVYSFLDLSDKLNMFSTMKCFKADLCGLILEKKRVFEDRNDITFMSSIDDKINELRMKYKEEELDMDAQKFQISRAAAKAVELLNDESYNKVFYQAETKQQSKDVIFAFRVFFQFTDNNELCSIKDDNEFWKKVAAFILENNNKKTGTYFIKLIDDFNFNSQNIEIIKRLCCGKLSNIKPTYYSKICGTTSLIIFLLKDTLEYCGIIANEKKNSPAILYSSLCYIKEIEERLNKYVEYLNKG